MRKALKILSYSMLVCALLFIALYATALVYILSLSHSPNIPKHADAALVLGAKVNLDNSPSEALYHRTLAAADLYSNGIVDYIVVTGGVGLGATPESEIATKIAIQHGVPKEKIISEEESHNTFDNIGDVQPQTHSQNIYSVIVTSDRYHVARGVLVAKHFGFHPVYWDYPDQNYYTKKEILWSYAREALAIIAYTPKLIQAKN